jgi:hypothetical protein
MLVLGCVGLAPVTTTCAIYVGAAESDDEVLSMPIYRTYKKRRLLQGVLRDGLTMAYGHDGTDHLSNRLKKTRPRLQPDGRGGKDDWMLVPSLGQTSQNFIREMGVSPHGSGAESGKRS